MKTQENYKQDLEEQIRKSLGWGWCGDLGEYGEFVRAALTAHLYNVMNNEDKRFKPTFEEWENYLANNENLVDMLHQLNEYQNNEEFRLPEIFENA